LSWPLPDDLDGLALVERLFKRSEEELRQGRPEPDWLEVHRQRKRGKHVTLQLLWLEYKAANPAGLSYTQFWVHYRTGAAWWKPVAKQWRRSSSTRSFCRSSRVWSFYWRHR
jgi:transposase